MQGFPRVTEVLKVQKVFSGSGSSKEIKKIELDSEEGPSCSNSVCKRSEHYLKHAVSVAGVITFLAL